MKTTIQLIIVGIVIMLFSSCYNSKKATEQVNKADAKYPEIVAKLARDKYPCQEILKPDTTIVYEDSLIFIECPDSNYNAGEYATVRTDTIYRAGENRTVRVPVKVLIPSKVINHYYEDSAKLKLLAIEIARLQKLNESLQATNDSLNKKVSRKSKENWIWRIIALALIAWQVIRLWKNITTIKVK